MLAFYDEEVEMVTDPRWPDPHGRMPFGILFTLQDGLVIRHQWHMDRAAAREAAGLEA